MWRYDERLTQMIFTELQAQGRTQRWLARQLNEWEPRLSDWKAGRKRMPDAAVERACDLLGIPESVLSFFGTMSPNGDEMTPQDDRISA